MKKMILTLAIAVSTLSAFAGEGNVNQKVLDAFNTEFSTAKEVEWTAGNNYYRATFTYMEKHVFAYYNLDGTLLGMTRYISPADLPMSLQNNLKKNYDGYWVSDLFEVVKNDEAGYYITLENADTKLVLKAADIYGWSVFSKTKKS
jgi:CRISPR/Cas system-associated exonuclease Cas4 (RecB family)